MVSSAWSYLPSMPVFSPDDLWVLKQISSHACVGLYPSQSPVESIGVKWRNVPPRGTGRNVKWAIQRHRSFAFGNRTLDSQLVGNLEDALRAIGTSVRQVLVRLSIDYTVQSHIAILNGNANWAARINRVLEQ